MRLEIEGGDVYVISQTEQEADVLFNTFHDFEKMKAFMSAIEIGSFGYTPQNIEESQPNKIRVGLAAKDRAVKYFQSLGLKFEN
ncbi:MAG: hypothetical protein Q8L52_01720 [bacterium]|nr:hypothetical protein [bacterium]